MEKIDTLHIDRIRHDLNRIKRDMKGISPKASLYMKLKTECVRLEGIISALEKGRATAV